MSGRNAAAIILDVGGMHCPSCGLLIDETLERYGLPKDLFYVAMIESGFEPAARSRVGAGGIWQFMPSAARTYGLEISYWVDAGKFCIEPACQRAARRWPLTNPRPLPDQRGSLGRQHTGGN